MSSLGAASNAAPEANGVYNAVTPQALCVVNAVYDRRLYHARSHTESADYACLYPRGEAANFSARRHELAFTTSAPRKLASVGGQMSSTQNDVPLLTSFNGLAISKNDVQGLVAGAENGEEDKLEQLYRVLRDQVRFVGVNLQTVDAVNANRSDIMASVIAGMFTVVNTGPSRINIMEKVVWDVPALPFDKRRGAGATRAGGKALAQIKSYTECVKEAVRATPRRVGAALQASESAGGDDDFAVVTIEKALGGELARLVAACGNVDVATAKKNLAAALTNEKSKPAVAFTRFIEGVRHLTDEVDSRVIGTATHSAQPGAQADILIRHAV